MVIMLMKIGRRIEARSSMKLAVIGIKVTTTVRFTESGVQTQYFRHSMEDENDDDNDVDDTDDGTDEDDD